MQGKRYKLSCQNARSSSPRCHLSGYGRSDCAHTGAYGSKSAATIQFLQRPRPTGLIRRPSMQIRAAIPSTRTSTVILIEPPCRDVSCEIENDVSGNLQSLTRRPSGRFSDTRRHPVPPFRVAVRRVSLRISSCLFEDTVVNNLQV